MNGFTGTPRAQTYSLTLLQVSGSLPDGDRTLHFLVEAQRLEGYRASGGEVQAPALDVPRTETKYPTRAGSSLGRSQNVFCPGCSLTSSLNKKLSQQYLKGTDIDMEVADLE